MSQKLKESEKLPTNAKGHTKENYSIEEKAKEIVKSEAGKKILTREDYKNTPITIIGTEERWWICMGKNRMVDKEFYSYEEAEEYIEDNQLEIAIQAAGIMIMHNEEIRESIKG